MIFDHFRCYKNYWNKMRVPAAKEYIHSFLFREETGENHNQYYIFYKIDRKTDEPNFIINYADVHLYNTLAKELIGAGEKGAKTMSEWVVYMLYYYRFFRSQNMEEMCNAVLSDIADIISMIIRREYTTYREFSTGAAIDALRWKYKSERILQLGKAPTNINLRRRF